MDSLPAQVLPVYRLGFTPGLSFRSAAVGMSGVVTPALVPVRRESRRGVCQKNISGCCCRGSFSLLLSRYHKAIIFVNVIQVTSVDAVGLSPETVIAKESCC
jgi:hypothetical protein